MAPNDSMSTSRWRRNRSNLTLDQDIRPTLSPATTMDSLKPTPTLERKSSRMSIFNLFSKPKVEKARGHTEFGLAVPTQSEEPQRPASPAKSTRSALRPNPPPHTQQIQRSRSSQFLRPTSMRPPSIIRPPGDDWDPPPLLQAYPQSIKYGTVKACATSPDALIRSHSQRRQAESIRERMDSHRDLSATLEPEHRKLEKHHKRLEAVLHASPQLADKMYVLMTSGYLLQYAGDGPLDRLPERALKLGKDSAAFASDLIPGKHWVLQVIQSANEDGTVSEAPKHSLLSRLRLGGPTRREAASLLLVMESAEEMESWMSTVRREIENIGGMKASSESIRETLSIDEAMEQTSAEQAYRRRSDSRGSSRFSSVLQPIDSPLQSQYSGSPKVVASSWQNDRKEKTSAVDSASIRSSRQRMQRPSVERQSVERQSVERQSVEAPSITLSTVSNEQIQLDQLREEPSRHSYVSTATTASGPATRNTSRNTSPAPSKEGRHPVDVEPRRSETSLRSFHMHPGNNSTRRRSMHPLPITNEDNSVSAHTARRPTQRHSLYGPTSPTSESKLEAGTPMSYIAPINAASTNDVSTNTVTPSQTPVPARYSLRSCSAPPSRNSIAPPPQKPLPTPPTARPQSSVIGGLAHAATPLPNPAQRRISATPKSYLRPFPVRPQHQSSDGSYIVPRRTSPGPGNKPARLPLPVVVNRSFTEPTRTIPSVSASASASSNPPSNQTTPSTTSQSAQSQAQAPRRPTSIQVNTNPAPFLAASHPRPTRVVSSTPSFVPGNRASSAAQSPLRQSGSIPVLRGHGQQLAPPKTLSLTPRRSMPAIGLGPPAPPPNMPLPPPPPPGAGVGRGLAVR